MIETYVVYVQADLTGNIMTVNSSAFLTDTVGWTQIDEGVGDRYHHAQGNYFYKPVTDNYGRCNYRLAGEKAEEIPDADKPPIPEPPVTAEERLAAAEAAILAMMG